MEPLYILSHLLIELLILSGFLVSAKYNVPSSNSGYDHLYVTGFVMLARTAFTINGAIWPDKDSMVRPSHSRVNCDQHLVAFLCERLGGLILTAGIYLTCYLCTRDRRSFTWSFALAVAAAWTFVAGLIYSSIPNVDLGQRDSAPLILDMLQWSAFAGLAIGTLFVQRIPGPAPAFPSTTRTLQTRVLQAAMFVAGLLGPVFWIRHLKRAHASNQAIIEAFRENSTLFLHATIFLMIWTASYLTVVQTPALTKSMRTNLAWLLPSLMTEVLKSGGRSDISNVSKAGMQCDWKRFVCGNCPLLEFAFLTYATVAIAGVLLASITVKNVTITPHLQPEDVKVGIEGSAGSRNKRQVVDK